MSMTPIHIFAALPFAKNMDYKGFIWANVLIDLEVVVQMLMPDWVEGPLHGWPHSFEGATAVALLICLLRWRLSWGVLLGAWSHIIIDMLFHADVRPFVPWSYDNPFAGLLQPIWIDYFLIGLPVILWKRTKLSLESLLPERFHKRLW